MVEKKKKVIILLVMVLLLVGIVIGVTYAAFTFSKAGTTENAVKTGAVTMTYTEGDNGITINNAMPISDEIGKKLNEENQIFDFTININITGKMGISYEVTAEKDQTSTLANNEVRLYLEKSLDRTNYEAVLEPSYYTPIDAKDDFGAKAGEMILDNGTTSETVTYYYRLRMWVDEDYELSEVAKKFTVRVNAYGKDGTYTENDPQPKNVNIKEIYTYNEESGADNYCVTGEEATCQKTTCFKDESVGSCPAGTIIKYQVNDTDIVGFNVLVDKGNTMTMQSQKKINNNTKWYASSTNTSGPTTALTAIENATSSWSNVNNQTYSIGDSSSTLGYSGCSASNSCTAAIYKLEKSNVKARMITVQEALNYGGCTTTSDSCRKFMTANENYWTMSAFSSSSNYAWIVENSGNVIGNLVLNNLVSRVVVEVNK